VPEAVETGTSWGRRLLIGGVLGVAIVVVVLLASAAAPRWWAHQVGDRVDGSITQGVFVGLFYGFFFTFLALMVLVLALRRGRTAKAVGIGFVAALILALPNLMTLGIVLGVGNGAHAGDRTLDVEAPAFRGATLAGAVLAGLLAGYIWYLLASRDRAREKHRRTEARLEEATSPPPEVSEAPTPVES
jgi:MFS family permease